MRYAAAVPAFKKKIALGYVRREHNELGTTLQVQHGEEKYSAIVTALPFNL